MHIVVICIQLDSCSVRDGKRGPENYNEENKTASRRPGGCPKMMLRRSIQFEVLMRGCESMMERVEFGSWSLFLEGKRPFYT